jgi:hypothetical protein
MKRGREKKKEICILIEFDGAKKMCQGFHLRPCRIEIENYFGAQNCATFKLFLVLDANFNFLIIFV